MTPPRSSATKKSPAKREWRFATAMTANSPRALNRRYGITSLLMKGISPTRAGLSLIHISGAGVWMRGVNFVFVPLAFCSELYGFLTVLNLSLIHI